MPTNQLLTSDSETMRQLGYRTVDMLIAHLQDLAAKRVIHSSDRAALEELLGESWQSVSKMTQDELFGLLEGPVLGETMHVNHPRFFAYVPGPGNFVSVLAETLAAGYNVFAGTWQAAAGPAVVENTVLDWLREICSMPAASGGLFVSGGSVANITALAVAREQLLGNEFADARIYFSDQTHSSVERGLRLLGFSPAQLRRLPSDSGYRLDMQALAAAVAADRTAGHRPFCVVANAGTTNTGAVDPLAELAVFCRAQKMWLHADGAYGAAAAVCERGKTLLDGLGEVDSLSLDPHKWLFQPFETGCVLVRNRDWLHSTFSIMPEYLKDTQHELPELNYWERGIQLTRSFRALKLWMSVKYYGRKAFEDAVRRGFELAEFAELEVRKMPGWQITTPAAMGIVTFRYLGEAADGTDSDDANRAILKQAMAEGYAMLSSTVLQGETVLRMCCINPRTTREDISATLNRLQQYAGTHKSVPDNRQ